MFDIKHGSINDGPGFRTTVFLKGCYLSCEWCQNPESKILNPQLMVYEEKCLSAQICEFCRRESLLKAIEEKRNPQINELCPAEASIVIGKYMTVKEVLHDVAQDKRFYGNDGGMTLCGGEPLFQREFSLELLKGVKNLGIGTALYTAGCYQWEQIEEHLQLLDLIIFDVKHLDPVKHKQGAGVSNEIILSNLKKLPQSGKRIWIRIPVIPGFNDSHEEIQQIVTFVKSFTGVERIELLPYNTTAKGKCLALGISYPQHIPQPDLEKFRMLQNLVQKNFIYRV
ncbi:MAG: glycyl-radical enzyme activating protein [Patescibacteria group bacterium]|nr:glycyl-radical enzyme activating protein [Patescibacteria group bacterium]